MRIARTLTFLLLLVIAAGCDSKGSSRTDFTKELDHAVSHIKETVTGLKPHTDNAQKIALDELEKLYAIEYKVVPIEEDVNPLALEKTLSELGSQRWDCFHAQSGLEKMVFYCKRRPLNYLTYFSRLFRVLE